MLLIFDLTQRFGLINKLKPKNMKQTIKQLLVSALLLGSLSAVTLIMSSTEVSAQAPKKFNYQGIARDAKGNPMANQQLSLKISILPTQDAAQAEYEETQVVKTNEFGLYTLQIGSGQMLNGAMNTVTWETGNKYIRVAIDPTGGSNYADAGTTQLLSVPYALYADKAGSSAQASGSSNTTRATNNYIEKTNGSGVANSTSLLYDDGTNIGLGTTTPVAKFHINQNTAAVQEHLRMQNLSATGAGRFTLYNNSANSYSTFTKYGTTYAGNYGGSTQYPYANLLAFGNNGVAAGDGLGRFLITNGGNIGMSFYKGGITKLKFHADYTTENVGIGGNSDPIARIHGNNTDGATMDLRLTNNTTGHLVGDGLEISAVGTAANITNKENNSLSLGTNNTARMSILGSGFIGVNNAAPAALLHLKGNSNGFNAGIRLEDDGSTEYGDILCGQEGLIYRSASTGNDHLFLTSTFGSVSSPAMAIKDNGNVGIGVLSPTAKLEVGGQVKITGGTPGTSKVLTSDATGLATWNTPAIITSVGTTNYVPKFTSGGTALGNSTIIDDGNVVKLGTTAYSGSTLNVGEKADQDTASISLNTNGQLFTMFVNALGQVQFTPNQGNPASGTPSLTLDDGSTGAVIIGNVSSYPSGYKLFVENGILTERLKVAVSGSANWADYVFADNYKLLPLEEVEAFVKENKHLPNVPSADQMVESGIDVATVDAKLMEKIEELTLYMIEMKKEMKALKAENEIMKANFKK